MQKITKRISTALMNALSSGVVPRVGLEHIAVGREKEIYSLSQDLENLAEGGAAFRFIVGRSGSGKSFLLQLIRNYAMEQGFVVADADLSPERRLPGSKNQAVATGSIPYLQIAHSVEVWGYKNFRPPARTQLSLRRQALFV